MRNLIIIMGLAVSACSTTKTDIQGGADGDLSNTPEVSSNVADVYFGDPLPSPVRLTNLPHPSLGAVAALVREGNPPAWYKADPMLDGTLFPTWPGDGDAAGTITFTAPILVPLTGTFRLVSLNHFKTKPFKVTARSPAYVQCLDANVLAGASSQDPTPFRGQFGACTMSRSGGDTTGRTIAHASCATPKGQSDCAFDATQKACVGSALPFAQRRVPGDAVTLSWSGGDVPAGNADVVVPSTVELQTVPSEQPMSADLEVTFTGGAADAELRMTLYQTSSGSLVAVDCDVKASDGRVVLPKEAFLLLEAGTADLLFTNQGVRRVHLDAWEVEASAPGLVQKGGALVSSSFPLTLRP